MRFRRVVIGVDFTEASLAAARWVALQFAPDAEVVLVHALPSPNGPSYLRPFFPDPIEVSATLAPTLYGGLRGLAGLIGAERARIHMIAGRPADALAAAAAQLDADLVCVGRGTRRRGSARFGATTAQRLLARTRVPVIVVPAGSHAAPTRIVAAVDERPGAEVVLRVACGLAAAFEARVDALHVLDGDVQALADAAREIALASRVGLDLREPREPRGATEESDSDGDRAGDGSHPHSRDLSREDAEAGGIAGAADATRLDTALLHDVAHAWLRTALDEVGAAPGRSTPVVRVGDPGPRLIAHARQHRADLMVLGRGGDRSHADLPARSLPVGSTSRLVAWAAPCPVLVLPLDAARLGDGDGARVSARARGDAPQHALVRAVDGALARATTPDGHADQRARRSEGA